ncbi:unnamed protein product [Moneuplotes crassus]|uniref:Uncharacterized protein n=1 Tax=Euplotes crassus TaxID=5936 RepID=A0AAD1XES8_EUPCR|nr:unnamed protein product [Moneuplotes crassus]
MAVQYNYKFAGLVGNPTIFQEDDSSPDAPKFLINNSAKPTVTKQGVLFPSGTSLIHDKPFEAPHGQFSFQYWAYFFTSDRVMIFQGAVKDTGTIEGFEFDSFPGMTGLKAYSLYKTVGNSQESFLEGWNRLRCSNNGGFLNSKLYNKAIGEVDATTYSHTMNLNAGYKLGSLTPTSNHFLIHSFTFTDDTSLVALDSSALYQNTLNTCGDGIVQPTNLEQCDDGNFDVEDGCNDHCFLEVGSCTQNPSTCFTQCGDGIKDTFEECDDGNEINSDGCDSNCNLEDYWTCIQPSLSQPTECTEDCGDGRRFNTLQSYCDDGNKTPDDGCSDTCSTEAGYKCQGGDSTTPDTCAPICGDGLKIPTETCDDNNTNSDDGCSNNCQREDGWTCTGGSPTQKDICHPICGDGKIEGNEECDDGNLDPRDGCSSTCNVEQGWNCILETQSTKSQCQPKCDAEHCEICEIQNSTKCYTCDQGYTISKDFKCKNSEGSEYVQTMTNSMTALLGIGTAISLCVSILNLSAPMTLWAMANQMQLMLILLLTQSSLPDDIVGLITNNDIFSFNLKFLQIKSNKISHIPLTWLNKVQTDPALVKFGLESGSCFSNNFSLILTFCVFSILHLLLLICPREVKDSGHPCRNKLAKPFGYLWRMLTFGIYIRLFLEAFQFIYISSLSELWEMSNSSYQDIVSGSFALFALACCLIVLIISTIQALKQQDENSHGKLEEFITGLKPLKLKRLYIPILILRRILFGAILIICEAYGHTVLVGPMLLLQVAYSANILYLRPMESKLNNLVECTNEIFYIFFVAFLLKFNSEQKWEGWPTSVYLWVVLANSAVISVLILAGGVSDCVNKISTWKCKKPMDKMPNLQNPSVIKRTPKRFVDQNLDASEISVSKPFSQVTTKHMRRNVQGQSLNQAVAGRIRNKGRVMPILEGLDA